MRYFFHLCDDGEHVLDKEGQLLDSIEKVQTKALFAARDIMSSEVLRGELNLAQRIDVQDQSGAVVFSLPFDKAVTISPGLSGEES